MNAPLTSNHYYVGDLAEDLDLLQNSQDVEQALRDMGHDPWEQTYATLFVRYDEDAEPLAAWGCHRTMPRNSDPVYPVEIRSNR